MTNTKSYIISAACYRANHDLCRSINVSYSCPCTCHEGKEMEMKMDLYNWYAVKQDHSLVLINTMPWEKSRILEWLNERKDGFVSREEYHSVYGVHPYDHHIDKDNVIRLVTREEVITVSRWE